MSFTTSKNGRLCNQIIRNMATSFIAEKNNLKVTYSNFETISKLGIDLFSGENVYDNEIEINDENFFEILNKNDLSFNINPNEHYFQTKEIIQYIYSYLRSEKIKNKIKLNNKFNSRYNNNNDIFIHIRLGDVHIHNPGIKYYLYVMNKIKAIYQVDNIFIGSDSPNHPIVKYLIKEHNCILINYSPIETIMFGSTCKFVILSHGSFSAFIGWISYYSKIYYKKYGHMWFGDMFSIKEFEEINI